MRFFVFFISIILSFNVLARNDWYEVQSFKGFIGLYTIEMSIQKYSFGSGVNVKGSYFYNKDMTPIALYGKVENDELTICEVHDAKDYQDHLVNGAMFKPEKCEFKLLEENNKIKGGWSNSGKEYNVQLTASNSWVNGALTGESLIIPFWGSDDNYSFFGVYKINNGELNINEVHVVKKKSGKLIQTINPQSDKCDFGFYMTAIYQNLERDSGGPYLNSYSTGKDIINELRYSVVDNKYMVVD